MNGYIKLHRSMLDWEWFTDPITAHVWMYCLLRANYQPARWRGETLMPGQFITSLSNMAKECGITKGQLRTALNHLKSTQNITQSSAQHATLITVEKWGEYQCAGEKAAQLVAQKTTSRQHLDNISSTTDKEYKKEKEEKEIKRDRERNIPPIPDNKVLYVDGEEYRYRNGVLQYTPEETKKILGDAHQGWLETKARLGML